MKETRKVIFLVDMNAFFIGCEAVEEPSLRTKPAAVAGDPQRRSGIILTANYPARKYGVRTTMTIYQAQKLCPQITLIPPHRALYEKTSRMVMDLLGQYTPVMEQSSIDEAYLDLTGCERLWGEPLQAAQTIMERIGTELGLQCSIGISENKFLAKMAADFKKPQGITELWLRDVPRKLWQLPVGELYGIGKQTAAKLQSMGFRTVGDLAALDSAALRVRFGRYGEEMHRLANGLDDTPVTSPRMTRRSGNRLGAPQLCRKTSPVWRRPKRFFQNWLRRLARSFERTTEKAQPCRSRSSTRIFRRLPDNAKSRRPI